MTVILLTAAILLGASFGSFLAATLVRFQRSQGLGGRSICDVCGEKLRLRDNIPVLSWMILRGRSHCCQARIPLWYFLLEVFFATGAFLLVLVFT